MFLLKDWYPTITKWFELLAINSIRPTHSGSLFNSVCSVWSHPRYHRHSGLRCCRQQLSVIHSTTQLAGCRGHIPEAADSSCLLYTSLPFCCPGWVHRSRPRGHRQQLPVVHFAALAGYRGRRHCNLTAKIAAAGRTFGCLCCRGAKVKQTLWSHCAWFAGHRGHTDTVAVLRPANSNAKLREACMLV